MNNIIRKASLVLTLVGIAIAAAPQTSGLALQSSQRLLTEVTDEPAWWWMVWWAGVGELQDFGISNTMQGGVFARHPDDEHPYRGERPFTGYDPGPNGEYPAGSEQYYLYAMGFWFGALYPEDSEWIPNVSKAAPTSDLGAMSVPEMSDAGGMRNISDLGLYFSDMEIPQGYGYDGEGDQLFIQPGDEDPEPHQISWPFADTSLNKYLEWYEQIDPSQGDIFSDQSSYAVGGDWIPEGLASALWIRENGSYDGQGLGIRVEQRTYSWEERHFANVIVVNYKIRNMNHFPLRQPCFSYFMDPDIGEGGEEPGDDGFWDDLIGLYKPFELVYAYDANNYEDGWIYPRGYIGVTILETPYNLGLTGVETFTNGDSLLYDDQDPAKYNSMLSHQFDVIDQPNDVMMIVNSGPYPDLAPGQEYNFTIAVVAGETYQELRENTRRIRVAYDKDVGIEETPVISNRELDLELISSNVSASHIEINYSLSHTSNVSLAVFDPTGRKITTLYQGPAPAGSSNITWPVTQIPAGVYFVRLQAGDQHLTERVVVVR